MSILDRILRIFTAILSFLKGGSQPPADALATEVLPPELEEEFEAGRFTYRLGKLESGMPSVSLTMPRTDVYPPSFRLNYDAASPIEVSVNFGEQALEIPAVEGLGLVFPAEIWDELLVPSGQMRLESLAVEDEIEIVVVNPGGRLEYHVLSALAEALEAGPKADAEAAAAITT